MTDLKTLDLTEADFDLIVQGLDVLPKEGLMGDLMGDMLMGMMTREEDKKGRDEILADRKRKERLRDQEKKRITEDVRILQGKLIQLKRYLQEQGALRETVDILNHVK